MLGLIIVAILMIALGPRAFYGLALSRRSEVMYIQSDLKDAPDDSMQKLLFELGQLELKQVYTTADRPEEFFKFDHRQRIRQAGFDPIWRDDRYILRDLSIGNESDPFLSKRGIEFRYAESFETGRRTYERGKWRREGMMDFRAFTYDTPSRLLPELYYYHLNDFHFVMRDGRSVYVRDTRGDEQELTLEAAFLMHETMAFNVAAFPTTLPVVETSEAYLKERGFIMKRRGGAYFPVSLETGITPELPPKSIFVDAALDELNNQNAVTKFVAKTTLDMYEVEIAWNEAEKRYEIVR